MNPATENGTSQGPHPFGRPTSEALEAVGQVAKASGLKVRHFPGYAVHAEVGKGPDLVGIMAHVDVVAPGSGWTVSPFAGCIRDGRLYGRGAVDNKGPLAATLFALQAIHALRLPCRKRARLIVGGDEEGGWVCMDHYFRREERPSLGFTPDGFFPVVCTEQGVLGLELAFPWSSRDGLLLIESESGRRSRSPFPPVRLRMAAPAGDGAGEERPGEWGLVARFLAQRWGDGTGETWGIAARDRLSGALTVAVEQVVVRRDGLDLSMVVRYPLATSGQAVLRKVSAQVEEVGGRVKTWTDRPPHHVPPESPLVKTLQSVFFQHWDRSAEPVVARGASLARCLEEGVAFGPVFPGEPRMAHRPDESISVVNLVRCARIYAEAIYALIQ